MIGRDPLGGSPPPAERSSSAPAAPPPVCRSPGCSRPAAAPRPCPEPGSSSGSGRARHAAKLGPGGLPLARPDDPLTLPIYADNKPIASGLQPEKGPLQLYNWIEYINPDVVKAFEKKYSVKVQISTFDTIDEAVAKLDSAAPSSSTCSCPSWCYLEQLVVGKILQPLNLSYIPNLKANVWPSLQQPVVRRRRRYTVPYTIYTTGIGWRADKLPGFNPANAVDAVAALWSEGPKISGKVGMLDDQHEGLTMGLLHNGVTDVNTENPAQLNAAQKRDPAAGLDDQPEVRHQRVPAPRRRLAVAAPGVVGRHGRRSPYYAAEGHQADGVRATGGPPTAAARSTTTRSAVAQGRQEPGARAPVPQPPARHPAGVLELQLHLLPAAAQRDDARGGGHEGPGRARTSQTR